MPASVDIGNVDATICAKKTVLRLGDESAILAANDGAAFAQRKLDDASVKAVLFCPRDRIGRWRDGGKLDQSPLGFRDDLVFDDNDVARLKLQPVAVQGFKQFIGDAITALDVIRQQDRD